MLVGGAILRANRPPANADGLDEVMVVGWNKSLSAAQLDW
jgi:hypothetical protein